MNILAEFLIKDDEDFGLTQELPMKELDGLEETE